MANRERSEIELTLGGKKVKLRPTFEALCEIEDKAGEGIPSLLFRFGKGTAGIKHIAAIIYGGMQGAGSDLSFQSVGEMVQDQGVKELILPCARFIAAAMSPPEKEGAKKGKPEGNDPEKPEAP